MKTLCGISLFLMSWRDLILTLADNEALNELCIISTGL